MQMLCAMERCSTATKGMLRLVLCLVSLVLLFETHHVGASHDVAINLNRATLGELVAARTSHDNALSKLRSKKGTMGETRCQRKMFDGVPLKDQIAEIEANRSAIQAEIDRRKATRKSKSGK